MMHKLVLFSTIKLQTNSHIGFFFFPGTKQQLNRNSNINFPQIMKTVGQSLIISWAC